MSTETPAADWGLEWNRSIKKMPITMYCDWVLANRPGFNPMDNLKLQAWIKTWKIAHRPKPDEAA